MSASRPVSGLKSKAKREVLEVMRDLSRVVSGRAERDVLMETRVEDITPVLGFVSFTILEVLGYQEICGTLLWQLKITALKDGVYHTHNQTTDRLCPRRR